MTAVLEARGSEAVPAAVALADCTLSIRPARGGPGRPNGPGRQPAEPGHRAAGPDHGTIEGLGAPPPASPAQLARVGFLAQTRRSTPGCRFADHLAFGAHLNPRWDEELARGRIARLDLDLARRRGSCPAASAPSSR